MKKHNQLLLSSLLGATALATSTSADVPQTEIVRRNGDFVELTGTAEARRWWIDRERLRGGFIEAAVPGLGYYLFMSKKRTTVSCVLLITATGTSKFAVPANWNNADNRIECYGSGGSGSSISWFGGYYGGGGGGGGAYAFATNVTLTPLTTVDVCAAAYGAPAGLGINSWFKNNAGTTIVEAGGGKTPANTVYGGGQSGGAGGVVVTGSGYSGGNGGSVYMPDEGSPAGQAQGGGGGCGGPNGAGASGYWPYYYSGSGLGGGGYAGNGSPYVDVQGHNYGGGGAGQSAGDGENPDGGPTYGAQGLVVISYNGTVSTSTQAFTSGSTFYVPMNWNNAINLVEGIGAGANGVASVPWQHMGGPGSGGGAYAAQTNVALTPGTAVTYQIGAPSGPGTSTPTWLKNNSGTIVMQAAAGLYGSWGGQVADCIGSLKVAGGGPTAGHVDDGDTGYGGDGGTAAGPGGVGSGTLTGGYNPGTGGGGGGYPDGSGSPGNLYGGGGGGGGADPYGDIGYPGAGRQGILVISYTPAG